MVRRKTGILAAVKPICLMTGDSKKTWNKQAGRVTAFGILILVMFLITIYELGVIYADWNRIRLINLNIRVLNEQSLPVSDVSLSVNDEFTGFTNMEGKVAALISKPGEIRIIAKKKPYNDIDTTIAIGEDGLDINFAMKRPYATLTVVTTTETGEPLMGVGITVDGKDRGATGDDGSVTISDAAFILDSVDVKLNKSGYDDVFESVYLADTGLIDSFTLVKRTAPARPAVVTKPKPKPQDDFQTYVNRASNYLDRAISGDSKYFGRALTEVEKAIRANPKSLLAKQLKVEILYNFAKSLRESNLPREAVNRLGEALKMYRDIPQDPLYFEVSKLKREIEAEIGE